MDQQLVIKLTSKDANGIPIGLVESPPILYSNFKAINPNTQFSDKANSLELQPFGYGVFEWAFKPIDLPYNKSVDEKGLTKNENGVWKPTFIIRDATEQELNEKKLMLSDIIKEERVRRLIRTDFFDRTDSPLSEIKKEEYRIYRQALRDITTQSGFPFNTQWPDLPK